MHKLQAIHGLPNSGVGNGVGSCHKQKSGAI